MRGQRARRPATAASRVAAADAVALARRGRAAPFPRGLLARARGRRDLVVIDQAAGPPHDRHRARARAHRVPPALGLSRSAQQPGRGRSSSTGSIARRPGCSSSPSPRAEARRSRRSSRRATSSACTWRWSRAWSGPTSAAPSRAASRRIAIAAGPLAPSDAERREAITHYRVLRRAPRGRPCSSCASAPGGATRSACSSPRSGCRSSATSTHGGRRGAGVGPALPARHAARLRASGDAASRSCFESAPPADWV